MSNETLLKVLEQKNRLLDINDELAEAIKEKNKEIFELKQINTELLECLQTATKIMKSGGLPVPVNFTKAIKKAKGDE